MIKKPTKETRMNLRNKFVEQIESGIQKFNLKDTGSEQINEIVRLKNFQEHEHNFYSENVESKTGGGFNLKVICVLCDQIGYVKNPSERELDRIIYTKYKKFKIEVQRVVIV